MKKRVLLIACALIIVALGLIIWQNRGTGEKNPASIHELWHIQAYAEDKGEDYAADMLDYLIVRSYKKTDLRKKWGTPTEIDAASNKDIWQLSEEYRLVIEYDINDEVKRIEVLPEQP